MKASGHPHTTHRTVDTRWAAVGDPRTDLAGWVRTVVEGGARIASVSLPADGIVGPALSRLAQDAFAQALDALPGAPARVWGFLPRPTDHDGEALERYMRFNAGRTAAYRAMSERIRVIPAGTCVGHAGANLVVHALWVPGTLAPIENPRQRPAWLYSDRYGPVPPAFTRAMSVGGTLIASGTASVVGEASMHPGDLDAQCAETLRNLDALAAAGGARGPWRSLQAYVRDAAHLDAVRAWGERSFPGELERVLHAPLCRADLLVEIEGVADAA
jgi:chorismate lyase/3-hydroxybenzoate synthase